MVSTEKLTNKTHDDFKVMVIDDSKSINITNNVNDTVTLTTGAGHGALHTDNDIDSDTDTDNDVNDFQDQDTDYSASLSLSPSPSPSHREKRSPTKLALMKTSPSPSREPKGRKCCGCPSIPVLDVVLFVLFCLSLNFTFLCFYILILFSSCLDMCLV